MSMTVWLKQDAFRSVQGTGQTTASPYVEVSDSSPTQAFEVSFMGKG